MIPNNILYRRILQALDTETEYAKFYSSLYYMKRIAMQYGASYTGCNCSNKYLKDWAELVGVELDGEHHTNNWYLRRIALKISGQSELEHNTDNYCLSLILENITPPTPTPTATQLKVYINETEIDTSQTPPTTILSYADSESADFKFIALDGNNDPVENYPITLTQGSNTYNLKTNSSGIATYTYESQGIGDTSVAISSSLLQETYVVHDYYAYKSTGSATFSSSSIGFISIYDLNDIGDCEITATLNSSVNKGFTLTYKVGNDTTTTNRVSVGADGSGYLLSLITENGSSTQHNDSVLYSANQDVSLLIRLENGNVLVKCNSNTFQSETHSNLTPRYVGIMSWNSAKTVQYSNLIVKKL